MREIDLENAAEFLSQLGWLAAGESPQFTLLEGGVSNLVMLVERQTVAAGTIAERQFVVKQARGQLAVAEPWFCSVDRLEREVDVLRTCQQILADDRGLAADHSIGVPTLYGHDPANHLYAMSAAGDGQRTWKSDLLAGEYSQQAAAACGWLLARLHAGSMGDPQLAEQLADQQYFEALRLDPYYRQLIRQHEELAGPLQDLICSAAEGQCLVHGDFSPKNLVVHQQQLTLIDFEVGHFGDPAFDLGFFQTHLVLKSILAGHDQPQVWQLLKTFRQVYLWEMSDRQPDLDQQKLERQELAHLGACLLARVDGKSPVDYLDQQLAQAARQLGRDLLCGRLQSWDTIEYEVASHAADRS